MTALAYILFGFLFCMLIYNVHILFKTKQTLAKAQKAIEKLGDACDKIQTEEIDLMMTEYEEIWQHLQTHADSNGRLLLTLYSKRPMSESDKDRVRKECFEHILDALDVGIPLTRIVWNFSSGQKITHDILADLIKYLVEEKELKSEDTQPPWLQELLLFQALHTYSPTKTKVDTPPQK